MTNRTEHEDELMNMTGVVGVADSICDNRPCLHVYVTMLTPELERAIAKKLEGVLFEIKETGGPIQAQTGPG